MSFSITDEHVHDAKAGELLNRVGIPSVVGELLTGLILGPAVLGIVSPNQVFSGLPI